MKKKNLLIVLGLVLALGITGCGKSDGDATNQNGQEAATDNADTSVADSSDDASHEVVDYTEYTLEKIIADNNIEALMIKYGAVGFEMQTKHSVEDSEETTMKARYEYEDGYWRLTKKFDDEIGIINHMEFYQDEKNPGTFYGYDIYPDDFTSLSVCPVVPDEYVNYVVSDWVLPKADEVLTDTATQDGAYLISSTNDFGDYRIDRIYYIDPSTGLLLAVNEEDYYDGELDLAISYSNYTYGADVPELERTAYEYSINQPQCELTVNYQYYNGDKATGVYSIAQEAYSYPMTIQFERSVYADETMSEDLYQFDVETDKAEYFVTLNEYSSEDYEYVELPDDLYMGEDPESVGTVEHFDVDYESEDGETLAYISYDYLVLPEDNEANKKINKHVQGILDSTKEYMDETVATLKEEMKNSSEDAYFGIPYGSDCTLSKIGVNDDKHLSYVMKCYDYLGGAHGMPYWTCLNFDKKTGENISLSEVVGLSEEELKDVCVKYFEGIIEANPDDYWEDALATVREFTTYESSFLLTKEGIMFFFSPYDLSSYAAGFQAVIIPYEELK